MQFNVRHCDHSIPRIRFSNGASDITFFRASEFEPLLWQMMIVLGIGNEEVLLETARRRQVIQAVYGILMVRAELWKTEIEEGDLPGLDYAVRTYVLVIMYY